MSTQMSDLGSMEEDEMEEISLKQGESVQFG